MTGVPSSQIDLEFADGRYLFRLGLAQIAELETKCGVKATHPTYGEITLPTPVGAIYARVLKGRYQFAESGETFGAPEEGGFSVCDLTETIRLGLIGGAGGEVSESPIKVDAIVARRLVEAYVNNQPLKNAWAIAAAVLGACCEGYVDPEATPPKKAEPGEAETPSTIPAP